MRSTKPGDGPGFYHVLAVYQRPPSAYLMFAQNLLVSGAGSLGLCYTCYELGWRAS